MADVPVAPPLRDEDAGKRAEWATLSGLDEDDAGAATTGSSLVGGGLWNVLSLLLPQAYTLAVSIVAARQLGPSGMGAQSFIAFVQLAAHALVTTGIGLATTRFVAEMRGAGRSDLTRALARRAALLTVAAATLAAAMMALFASLNGANRDAWIFAGLATVVSVFHAVPAAVLLGLQRWRSATIAGLVTSFAGTIATILVLLAGGGITGMFVVNVVVVAASLVWTGVLATRAIRPLIRSSAPPPADLWSRYHRFALIASVDAVVAFVVWKRTEFFFLERFSTDAEIALYSIAFGAVTVLTQIPKALETVLASAFATFFGAGDHDRIRRVYARAVRLVLLIAMPLTAAGIALGPSAIEAVYGSQYSGTRPIFVIMMVAFPAIPVLAVSNAVLSGLGKIRIAVIIATIASVVDIVLAFVLVPLYAGIGAALANMVAQLLVAVPVTIAAIRLLGAMEWKVPYLLRCALGASLTFVIATLIELLLPAVLGLVIATLVVVVLTVVLARALRMVPVDDAVWLDGAAGWRFRGSVGWFCRYVTRGRLDAARS